MLPLTNWIVRTGSGKENNGVFRIFETTLEAEEVPSSLKLVLNSIINQPIDNISPFFKHVEIAVNGVKLKDFQQNSPYGETKWLPEKHEILPLFGANSILVDITRIFIKVLTG